MLHHSAGHHHFVSFPSVLAVAVAAIIAIGIGIGANLLASRTSTSTVMPPGPATTQLIHPVSPAFVGVLERSRIRVLDPTKPPF